MLAGLGLSFILESADIDERVNPGEIPEMYVYRVAREKAETVAKRRGQKDYVLAADTAVSVGGHIFGKPMDRADAFRMLNELSGNEHFVTTGYAIALPGGEVIEGVVKTAVFFRELSHDEIEWYVDTGEPFDKAGAYAIQGLAGHFVRRIDGSVSNVIGLPLLEVVQVLRTLGFPVALKPHSP